MLCTCDTYFSQFTETLLLFLVMVGTERRFILFVLARPFCMHVLMELLKSYVCERDTMYKEMCRSEIF